MTVKKVFVGLDLLTLVLAACGCCNVLTAEIRGSAFPINSAYSVRA